MPVDTLAEIESGDVSQMIDSTAKELLAELDQKRKKLPWVPFIVVGMIVLVFTPQPVGAAALALSPVAI